MTDAEVLLDAQLKQLNRVVLRHGGRVKMTDAKHHAESEYDKWKAAQKAIRHAEADKAIAEIKKTQKALPKGKRSS